MKRQYRTPQLSIVICTLNRSHYLAQSLQSFCEQKTDPSLYELLIVDNGSTDDTNKIINRYRRLLPLKKCTEKKLGLSFARNKGWQKSRADIVAFVDDDAKVHRDWIKIILKSFSKHQDIGFMGGRIIPQWEAPRPIWLPQKSQDFLALMDLGDEKIITKERPLIAGANCVFRKKLIAQCSGFETNMGRKGTNLNTGEEIMLGYQIINLGYSCLYHPDLIVSHIINPKKLTKAWFTKRLFWEGISVSHIQFQTNRVFQHSLTTLLKYHLVRLIKYQQYHEGILYLFTQSKKKFQLWLNFIYEIGFIFGLIKLISSNNNHSHQKHAN